MTMQRRHFQMIADILAGMRIYMPTEYADRAAEYFADELRQTNPQFNRDKFLKACGVTGES